VVGAWSRRCCKTHLGIRTTRSSRIRFVSAMVASIAILVLKAYGCAKRSSRWWGSSHCVKSAGREQHDSTCPVFLGRYAGKRRALRLLDAQGGLGVENDIDRLPRGICKRLIGVSAMPSFDASAVAIMCL
jgi:hypothetical protein